MKYLDLNLLEPIENLACDEVLINWCAQHPGLEVLRVWEPSRYFVVVGYSNKVAVEVNRAACAADGVPVLRRCSGGGAVLQGPGCLNYTLVFSHEEDGPFGDLGHSYRFVLERHRGLFASMTGVPVAIEGSSDLVVAGRKFSGNSQYRKRRNFLIHGTFLLQLDLSRVARYLPMPSKEPTYRQRRPHGEFLQNLGIAATDAKQGLRRVWAAEEQIAPPPLLVINKMMQERYSRPQWNLKF
ncbi:MAG: lipoate--protein ligase family protein [Deltaproteobacteria bacterium]|nr:lipoate--protein ligase family protein [Deltaproteobacteria bacterium]